MIMPVGKYRGKTLKYIFNNDPEYLEWAWKTFDNRTEARKRIAIFYSKLGSELLHYKNGKEIRGKHLSQESLRRLR